jgi:hypothetical protein
MLLLVGFVQIHIARFDQWAATPRHGISGVYSEIQQNLFDLAGIGADQR